ncbi:MAG: hypothetical protein SGJ02_13005, partial [bacterium]|nr:hypothetical protein [bacterium]
MAIIKHGLNKDESRIISFPSGEPAQIPTIESDQIPFVVATELVPFAQSVSDQEVVAIAVALYKMLPK